MLSKIVRSRIASLCKRQVAVAAAAPFEMLEGRTLFCGVSPACLLPAPAPACTPSVICQEQSCGYKQSNGCGCDTNSSTLVAGASIASDFTNSLDLYGVLGVGNTCVNVSGPNTKIGGDLALGQNNTGTVSGTEIEGNLDIDCSAREYSFCNVKIDGTTVHESLATADSLALDASTRIANLAPTQTLGDVTCSTTLNSTSNVSVVNLKSLQLCGTSTLTINGNSGSYFMINVFGNFSMADCASIKLTGGIPEAHVLFNIVGCGNAVSFTGKSVSTGTILANDRDIDVYGATVNGAILGAHCHCINITCGAQVQVNAPHFQPPIGY